MDPQLKAMFETAVANKKVPGIGAFLLDSTGDFIYKEAWGTNDINDPNAAAFTFDTTVQLFSCTKLVTHLAALQLLEAGKLALTDPVEKYLPQIKNIQVLDGFEMQNDTPILRHSDTNATIQHLLAHTAGFTYDSFDANTLKWRLTTSIPPGAYGTSSTWAVFSTPFATDPGSKYHYGISTDWLGFVIQAIAGIPLAEYLDQHILKPLGMTKTGLSYTDSDRLWVHLPDANGALTAVKAIENNFEPEVFGGGAALYSTMNDYAKLLATVLNEGKSARTGEQILQPATIQKYVFGDLIPEGVDRTLLGEITSVNLMTSNSGSFIPTVPVDKRGWGAFLLNKENLPQGRKAGSGSWAGFANLYYWIDPTAKKAGMVATSLLPFMDRTVLTLFDAVERNAYGHPLAQVEDDGKGNFRLPS